MSIWFVYNDKTIPMLVKVRDLRYDPANPDLSDRWLKPGEAVPFEIHIPEGHSPYIKTWDDRNGSAVTLLSYINDDSIRNIKPAKARVP